MEPKVNYTHNQCLSQSITCFKFVSRMSIIIVQFSPPHMICVFADFFFPICLVPLKNYGVKKIRLYVPLIRT